MTEPREKKPRHWRRPLRHEELVAARLIERLRALLAEDAPRSWREDYWRHERDAVLGKLNEATTALNDLVVAVDRQTDEEIDRAWERASDVLTDLRPEPLPPAAMRCLRCKHEWEDPDAAVSRDLASRCPNCQSFMTEPKEER